MKNIIATFIIAFIFAPNLFGQITLAPQTSQPVCINVLNNSVQTFERDATCAGLILIRNTVTEVETFIDLDDDEDSFTFTFSSPGRYDIYCDAAEPFDPLMMGAAVIAACIDVVEPVPTMSEWGIICMLLILLIFGVNTIKMRQKQTAVVSI